jgi:hypothetical protein
MNWYREVSKNLDNLPLMIDHFEGELVEARAELNMKGITLEQHASRMPGIIEQRYRQLQEVEAVLEFLNIQMKKIRTASFKKFTHGYEKMLSSRDAEKYVDGEDEVIDMAILINDTALLRNQFLAVHKGLEIKHWQIANVIKLRCAGLEDVTVQ